MTSPARRQSWRLRALGRLLTNQGVPILFIVLSAFAIPYSGYSASYLVQELIIRLARNSFLVLSLVIPIIAGMGLNFGMVLGAMAGQVSLILISDWNVTGLSGLFLAMLLSIPLSILAGWISGVLLNRAKGREMVTSFILSFFANGIYQLIVLYGMGRVIPIRSESLLLSRGYGIRNAINLSGVRQSLDGLLPVTIWGVQTPLATFLVITLFCFFIVWLRGTKLGHDMRAVGQDLTVAGMAGIATDRTRNLAIIISTVLAGIGQIIYLQNIGTMNTYNSHEQIGMFSIAALLVGGASVTRATLPNVFVGVILFHLMFVTCPNAGKNIIGSAMLGEYFRVFVSYGVISIALVLYARQKEKEKEQRRVSLRQQDRVD